jgi:hypothetical protein
LGIPVNGVEDPGVSAIFRHGALLQGRAASCLAKAPCKVPSDDGEASKNDNGGFWCRDKWDKLRLVRLAVQAAVCGVELTSNSAQWNDQKTLQAPPINEQRAKQALPTRARWDSVIRGCGSCAVRRTCWIGNKGTLCLRMLREILGS